MKAEATLAAVINWNGWRDTLVCLDSMRSLSGPPFELLVCDNGSTDDSHERLLAWARQTPGLIEQSRVGLGRDEQLTTFARNAPANAGLGTVHIMRLPRNLGYAGAINRCIEWGRGSLAPWCYWLLNNDIAVAPGALQHMLEAVRPPSKVGLCGSVLLEWDDPQRVQAIGGIFHRLIATGTHLKQLPADARPDQDVFLGVDYPVGASLLVTREFIDSVGLMDEDYFLYYEEVDWAVRGRAKGFRPAVALRSQVRHKEGASTGSSGGARNKSMLSEYYGVVNRLRFTGKFSPGLVPLVWLSLFMVVLDRLAHQEWQRAGLVLRLMFRPQTVPRP